MKFIRRLIVIILILFVGIGGYVAASWAITKQPPALITKLVPTQTKNIVVMGMDGEGLRSDVLMVAFLNGESGKINLLSVPRDTRVPIDGKYHKINSAYALGKEEQTIDTLENLLDIKIDNYVKFSFETFRNVIDALGGVDFDVPQDMFYEDPYQDLYIDLKKGMQHLDGAKAEQFVRYRSGYVTGDIGRGNAQKLFISAFIKSLTTSLANADASMITTLAGNVINYVKTDMSVADIVYFGKSFLGIGKGDGVKLENISLMTMPGNATMYDGASVFVMNKAYVAQLINEYYNIYDYNITSAFDKNEFFVTREQSVVRDIYSADKESVTLTVYTAGSLDENGLE